MYRDLGVQGSRVYRDLGMWGVQDLDRVLNAAPQ